MEIRRISAAETIEIRWPILRDGFPRETAVFEGDDLPTTRHFGAFVDGRIVGVTSLYRVPFPEPNEELDGAGAWQLRGMATLPSVRGKGCGAALLQHSEGAAQTEGVEYLWCNARVAAVPFYERFGWRTAGDEFEIPTVGPHFRMLRMLIPVGRLAMRSGSVPCEA